MAKLPAHDLRPPALQGYKHPVDRSTIADTDKALFEEMPARYNGNGPKAKGPRPDADEPENLDL